MAIVSKFPSREFWGQVRKVLDYYYYKGVVCCRTMPTRCRQPGTAGQLQTWSFFRSRHQYGRLLKSQDKIFYSALARGSDRTWYDCYSSEFLLASQLNSSVTPIVYDLDYVRYTSFVIVYWRVSLPCIVDIRFWYGPPKDKPETYSWERKQMPNRSEWCRALRRLRYYLPRVNTYTCQFTTLRYSRVVAIASLGNIVDIRLIARVTGKLGRCGSGIMLVPQYGA